MTSRNNQAKPILTTAVYKQRQRAALAEIGFVQTKLTIPSSLNERLRSFKAKHSIRSVELIVAMLIEKAIKEAPVAEIDLPPLPAEGDPPKTIAIHIPRAHYDYMERVARHLRGVNLGVALEAIAAAVTDLTPAPMQLSLIEEDLP